MRRRTTAVTASCNTCNESFSLRNSGVFFMVANLIHHHRCSRRWRPIQ